MALQIGESIGHYQIVEELGAGGNGRVLKVQHLITHRREAMKILANGRPTGKEYAHRVLREIRLQASLDHPNIAAVLNAFWLEDDLAMIMELIDGVSLQQVLTGRKFNVDQSLGLIRQVLLALSYAHSHGVVHRDVSTANIIVSEQNQIKLTDFGLAKDKTDLNVTESGGMIGSPYYISPEQVRDASACDQRSDIYSTGVVLYELLTGTKPFESDSTFLLMQAHVQHSPQPPIERNAAIPQYISQAVLKALAKNPAHRYQSASDFLTALEGPVEPPASSIHIPSVAPVAPMTPIVVAASATKVKPWQVVPKLLRVPTVGAAVGIGFVVAAVAPMVYFNLSSNKPNLTPPPARSLPAAVVETLKVGAPMAAKQEFEPETEQLVSGPRQLPTVPNFNTATVNRAQTPARKTVAKAAATPAKITVWGEASIPSANIRPDVIEPVQPISRTAPVESAVRKMEDPPAAQSTPVQLIVEPAALPPGANAPRKGIFRRFASGVKALNPMRRDNAPDAATAVAKP